MSLRYLVTLLLATAIESRRRPAMDRRQQTLEMTISRPLAVNGARASLAQVLMSLANASLYAHDGGWIRVTADMVSRSSGSMSKPVRGGP